MSEIKLPVTVGVVDDGAYELYHLYDADGYEISLDQIAAALNAAPKRALEELTVEAVKEILSEAASKHKCPIWSSPREIQASIDERPAFILSRLQAFAAPVAEPLEIGYTNWRGEWAMRRIQPVRLWIGSTDWHPEPGLLLEAIDLDKNEKRHFAVKDFGPKREPAPVAPAWLPISSAPRDGTVILLFYNDRWVSPGAWSNADEKYPWVIMDDAACFNGAQEKSVTHWMPLPAAPEAQGGADHG